ncbi:MAG: type II secretion system F family protein [Phycisphaerales bacterium]|nr:type II secretion system F family protein [Phycisphaerales bacterium]
MIAMFEMMGAFQGVLLILLPLVGSVMLAYGVFQVVADLRSSDRKKVMDRLRNVSERGRDKAEDPTDFRRAAAEASGMLANTVKRFSFTQSFQRVLEQGNVQAAAPNVLVNILAASLISLAILWVLKVNWMIIAGVPPLVLMLPITYFYRRRKKRLNKLVEQLPDVFELLAQALRAGHSLASGMQLVAREMPDPAGTEFGRVFHEQNLGLKIEDALRNMAERVDVLDVRFFVTAVLIQRQTGGDLAEVLDKIGSVIRERIKLFGTVKALTAEGRLSGYVLLALPGIVFFVMMNVNRSYAELLINTQMGQMMLGASIFMQFLGYLMIKKIVNIKV